MVISIHAAQEGCDVCGNFDMADPTISIHAAQEGCDSSAGISSRSMSRFQSTQPKRAATPCPLFVDATALIFQSTQPKRAATCSSAIGSISYRFQSTQPKRAATGYAGTGGTPNGNFNPRSPRGLRLPSHFLRPVALPISIHAAQEGCDSC